MNALIRHCLLHAKLLYLRTYYTIYRYVFRECNYITQTIFSVLNDDETMIIHDPIYIFSKDFNELGLIRNMGVPKGQSILISHFLIQMVIIIVGFVQWSLCAPLATW